MLNLVGVTRGFNSDNAHAQMKDQKKIRLAKGVYCDAEDMRNLPSFLRTHAQRIANYLYPNAALIQSSAHLKGMVDADVSTPLTPRFKLFIAGNYFRHTHVTPMLEIVHLDTLANKEIKRFCREISDGRDEADGRMTLMCASDELVFLQNFGRRRSQLERFLENDRLFELRERLEKVHGNELPERLSTIMRQTGEFGVELERALNFLKTPLEMIRRQEAPANLLDFTLGWQGRPVATLGYNGVNWSFSYLNGWNLPMQSQNLTVGQIPAFINNLLPEGPVRDMLRSRLSSASTTLLESSERFMSNISIVQDPQRLETIPLDILDGRLKDFMTPEGVFRGTVSGLPAHSSKIMRDLSEVILNEDMTRVAGMQPKIMMNLSFDGELQPSSNKAATHILKFPGQERDGSSIKGVVEWASMTLAQGSGMNCAQFALIRLAGNDKDVLGYVTERFDIPQSDEDMRMIFVEDVCAVLGYPPEAKGMPSLNEVIEKINSISTHKVLDMEELFKQITVNYLLENADFHAKNASVIKVSNPMLDEFKSVRMAPAYDILRTRTFAAISLEPGVREPMQLGFQSRDEFVDREWKVTDFEEIGELCGLSAERSLELLRQCAVGISKSAVAAFESLPAVLKEHGFELECKQAVDVFQAAAVHCHEFFPDLPSGLKNRVNALALETRPTKSKVKSLQSPSPGH